MSSGLDGTGRSRAAREVPSLPVENQSARRPGSRSRAVRVAATRLNNTIICMTLLGDDCRTD